MIRRFDRSPLAGPPLATVLTVALALGALARAQQPAAADVLPPLVARLEAAVYREDAAAIKAARLDALRLLAASPAGARVAALRYTAAYAAWRLAFSPVVDARERALQLDDAVAQLEAVIEIDPRHADALGLLAAVYGAQIARAPDLGMTLGPSSGQLLGRALAIAPDNPRVLVIRGQSLFNTPPEYGGSVRDSEAVFRRALQIFATAPAAAAWPHWGRFDAHVWLGQALAARGDKTGARAEYDRALVIAPESRWVKNSLLPAVKLDAR